MNSSRYSSTLAPSPGDVETWATVGVGVGEGVGAEVAVGVGEGRGMAVAVGVGRGVSDSATAPETGVGVAMLDMALWAGTRLEVVVAVVSWGGNVRRTGVPSACGGPIWLGAQANEPATRTSRIGISVNCLKGLFLSADAALVGCWKCSKEKHEFECLVSRVSQIYRIAAD